MYNPHDHYWLSKDGMLYSSARQCKIPSNDAGYAAWVAAGGIATAYPQDAAGKESSKELASVLAAYGIRLYPPTLAEVQAAKRAEIATAFDVAMSASITMPSTGAVPSVYEVATALYDWRTEDPEGYAALLAIHTARRNELLAAVETAETAEAVQAIAVNYAV